MSLFFSDSFADGSRPGDVARGTYRAYDASDISGLRFTSGSPALIAVIGCIGSGKTTLSCLLSRDFAVKNADLLAKEVLLTKRGELVARYGPDILLSGVSSECSSISDEPTGSATCSSASLPSDSTTDSSSGSTRSSYMLNKPYLAGILFQEDEEKAENERTWIAELINREVLERIASEKSRGLILAEITAPTSEFLKSFDGVIVISVDEEDAVLRTNHRDSAWSEERRRSIYRMQMERLSNCIRNYLNEGAFETDYLLLSEEMDSLGVFPDGFTGVSKYLSRFVLRIDNSGQEDVLEDTSKKLSVFLKSLEAAIMSRNNEGSMIVNEP